MPEPTIVLVHRACPDRPGAWSRPPSLGGQVRPDPPVAREDVNQLLGQVEVEAKRASTRGVYDRVAMQVGFGSASASVTI
ncbi:MAG: hypothetical protein QOG46_2043 [Pseudonocardiales bacterium]|nr:hypothetical protein [Pseudonocardiales bacterium]